MNIPTPHGGTAASDSLLAQCIHEAMVASRPMMVHMVDKAVVILRARQSAETELSARMALGDTADVLMRHKDLLAERFPGVLQQALETAARSGPVGVAKAPAAGPLRFDQLELMDDEQVQGRIETARMQQSALLSCERELAELDALVCAARGFASVHPDRNPFRPQTFSLALTDTLALSASTAAQRVVWMQALAAVLGEQLRKIYKQLLEFLGHQRVQAASYVVSQNPESETPTGRSVQRMGTRAASAAGAERAEQPRLTVGQLRQVLGAEHPRSGSAPGYDADLEDVMQDLSEMHALVQQLTSQSRAVGTVPDDASDAESQLHTSRAQAISVHESIDETADAPDDKAVAQDVVRMMVDNLCDDERLLPCVRDWVGSLEPPLLALAAVDVSFLSDKQHPARVLLDEVTARSLGFASDTVQGFTDFFDPVIVISAQLKPHDMPSAQPFVEVLRSVQQAWAQQKSSTQMHREQAMQALLQAEQRNLLADKIALELTRRDDARLAPIFVKQFLAGPWSQVLAQARLNPTHNHDAQTYLDLVSELLWSAVTEHASKQRQRLVRLIPGLLAMLRAGLATIGSPEHEGAAFFSQLMQTHEAALKAKLPTRTTSLAPSPTSAVPVEAATRSATEMVQEMTVRADDAVWLAPQEARDSGFMSSFKGELDSIPPATQPMAYDDDTPPAAAENAFDDSLIIIEPPTLGSWVEFFTEGKWVRAQLTWASPHGTLFMFTGAAGNPYSMTRRALDKMQARETMRIIAQDSVVVGALDAVAQAALRNTINPG